MHRRSLITAAVLLALVLPPAGGAATAFLVRGGGWGHGIGMSQWGAYGQSLSGRTFDQILAFYYRGTSLGQNPNPEVGVILATGRSSLTIASNAAFSVTGSGGRTWNLARGEHTIGPGLRVTTAGGRRVTLGSPARFHQGTRLLRLNGAFYRGDLEVASNGSALSAVNRLSLENYVRGVVSRESPSGWPLEALKAQAVAARSYAFVSSRSGRNLFPDTRDQVYGGVAAETAATDQAVRDTARTVVTYGGSVVQAFFFSSSGGRTASIADEWGGSPVPYLVSVNDSAYDKYSPYYRWGSFRYTQARVARYVTVPAGFNDMVVTKNGSGRAKWVDLIGSTTRRFTGAQFRDRFGLRSTRFGIGVLRLRGPHGTVAPGTRVRLAGFERFEQRGLGIQQKISGGSWQTAAVGITPRANGTFTVFANPTRTTWYRPISSHGVGPVIRVNVS